MVSTTTKVKRNKRPDARPNAKRRLKESQALVEKDRLRRVAANEAKHKIVAVEKLAAIAPMKQREKPDALTGQVLKRGKERNAEVRIRSLHKLLRQIQGLEDKKKGGTTLNDAQETKLARMEDVMTELEELQKVEDEDDEEMDKEDKQ